MSAFPQASASIDHLPRWTAAEPAQANVVLFGTGTVGSALLRRLAHPIAPPVHREPVEPRRTLTASAVHAPPVHGEPVEPRHTPTAPAVTAPTVHGELVEPRRTFTGCAPDPSPVHGELVDPPPHPRTHPALRALRLVGIANSRVRIDAFGDEHPADAEACIAALGRSGCRIAIDATASDALAGQHADWLARGIHVVTACKLGGGASLARWQSIRDAAAASGARYGDAATVGAGLPILRALRDALAAGDRIRAVAGSLSGSLGWILSNYDGARPFAALVDEARARGYTEPDPREDLGGEDVRRKLLIVARSAGRALEHGDVRVQSLAEATDATLGNQRRNGEVLRYIARLDDDGARAGLESLSPDDPLAQGRGCDNRVAIWTDRYRDRPLVIQGPGAGADVTAGALLEDALRILGCARRG